MIKKKSKITKTEKLIQKLKAENKKLKAKLTSKSKATKAKKSKVKKTQKLTQKRKSN